MNLSKLYKNTFLIVLLSFVLTACATQKKVTTETETKVATETTEATEDEIKKAITELI